MRVEILMPELGESVHEGTVSRWLKNVGDTVKEDEPIVEIMTDKVNTELQAPASGVLAEIAIAEGATVKVFEAMGFIETDASAAAAAPKPAEKPKVEETPTAAPAAASATIVEQISTSGRLWVTPIVRSMAKENNISDAQLASIKGSGEGGRINKKDMEMFLAGGGKSAAAAPAAKAPEPKPVTPTVAGADQVVVPLVGMRKMIADHMIRSSQVPTVTTITDVDVTNMVTFRDKNKDSFLDTYGVKLTYTPFFIKALTEALLEFPLVNSALQADNNIIQNNAVHMGVAVALGAKGEGGLIVPVIRDCHKKTLIDIARDLDGIAKKARSSSLKPEDVQGGTFTLTNPGTYGALFGTPMINAPQAGILGAYAIKKQAVVIDDMIAIRSIMHLVLTYDHRIIDGMVAGAFLASVRNKLQTFDFFK
ncbi:MAG TPA: dihydrolipoamide acetyltransferase family protein [Fimbriimonas sp.]|nr:dihydrolipoamide acetyltransferase family protein [Fimbriimonas sp.]